MYAQLAQLRAAELEPSELCARFLILHLQRLHGSNWLSSPRQPLPNVSSRSQLVQSLDLNLRDKQRRKIESLESARALFAHFYFRGVVLDAHEGFVGWSEGRYPLLLLNRIPSPEEMLDIQCEGKRYATLLLGNDEQMQNYGRHPDAAAFLLHDFEHAQKFFGPNNSHLGQLVFFRLLRKNLMLLERWQDLRFKQDLDYLKSDMNSHPVHLLKYLKAIVLSAEIRLSGLEDPPLTEFWRQFFANWDMDARESLAAMNLNQPLLETQKDQMRVYSFFVKEAHG